MEKNKNWKIINNSLIAIHLTKIRNKETKTIQFQKSIDIITKLLAFSICDFLKVKKIEIETPLVKTEGVALEQNIILVAILRAGLAMTESFRYMIPEAKNGHIGMFRDKNNFEANQYYYKLPKIEKKDLIIIFDPMIATGNTIIKTIETIKKEHPENEIIIVSLLVSREAQDKLSQKFPKITFFTTKVDPILNGKKYIIPGLGDFGDRFFGTV